MQFNRPIKLLGSVQHYPWGKIGSESLVATLAGLEGHSTPCAELWVGAHKNAPSRVIGTAPETTLMQLISEHPGALLGELVVKEFGAELPYLFKILSVRTALSIQAHPNSEQAELLFKRAPNNYPDNRHKPELAVAITKTKLLYGFRTAAEILTDLTRVSPFLEIVGEEMRASLTGATTPAETSAALKGLCERVWMTPFDQAREASLALYSFLKSSPLLLPHEKIILELEREFPEGDVGLFAFYLLNYDELHPGDGLFIEPQVAHAYLSGDIAECMANSDNVIRAGLTSKFKDISTLLSILKFDPSKPSRLQSIAASEKPWRTYPTPVREFQVDIAAGTHQDIKVPTSSSCQLLFILSGEGEFRSGKKRSRILPGESYFIPPNVAGVSLELQSGVVYRIGVGQLS